MIDLMFRFSSVAFRLPLHAMTLRHLSSMHFRDIWQHLSGILGTLLWLQVNLSSKQMAHNVTRQVSTFL